MPTEQTGKLFLETLAGRVSERVPFWFMRQAGRYLPEYRALREKKGGFLAMALDPESACEITMQPIRRFGMDAAIIFSDILTIPMALGQKLEFAAGEGPKLDPVGKAADIAKLTFRDFEKKLAPVYEALKRTRSALDKEGFNQTALIGFSGAPWTVATYMIEGGSSRTFTKAKSMMQNSPEEFSALMQLLVEATSSYLIRQIESGAEAIQIFDSWAGALDEDAFQKWSIEPTAEIVRNVRAAFPLIPIIGFPKGAGERYQAYAENTGVTALSLDPQISTSWAARNLQPRFPVQGNLDPALLIAGGDEMIEAAERILSDFSRGSFIFNLGHGIDKETPVAHVEMLVNFIKNWRRA